MPEIESFKSYIENRMLNSGGVKNFIKRKNLDELVSKRYFKPPTFIRYGCDILELFGRLEDDVCSFEARYCYRFKSSTATYDRDW